MEIDYILPASKFAVFMKRYGRAFRRNASSGLPSPVLDIIERTSLPFETADALSRMRGDDSRTVHVDMVKFRVSGLTAEFGDWSIKGYRTAHRFDRDGQPRIMICDHGEVPAGMKGRKLCCEHCGASRRRAVSYVVESKDGSKAVEVGSSCLSDFLGGTVAPGFTDALDANASALAQLSRLMEESPLASEGDIEEEIYNLLGLAHYHIRIGGYVPTKDATIDHPATWRRVMADLGRLRRDDEDGIAVTMDDFMKGDRAATWCASMVGTERDTGFFSKASRVIDAGISNMQQVPLVVGVVAAWVDNLMREKQDERREEEVRQSRHVGMPTERVSLVCSVRYLRTFIGDFGPRELVSMTDPDGNIVEWWASGSANKNLREGRTYEIMATIKKHDRVSGGRHAGARKTVVTRVECLKDFGPTVERAQPDDEVSPVLGKFAF